MMDPRLNIEKELTGHIGKELLCPDGETRTLKTFEQGRNGVTTLHFGSGVFRELKTGDFWNQWAGYTLKRKPDDPVDGQQLAEVALTPEVKNAELQAKSVMDTTDMVTMLHEQMRKVSTGSPGEIAKANAMSNLARQVIEAGKLKLNIMKTMHEFNQPAKS